MITETTTEQQGNELEVKYNKIQDEGAVKKLQMKSKMSAIVSKIQTEFHGEIACNRSIRYYGIIDGFCTSDDCS